MMRKFTSFFFVPGLRHLSDIPYMDPSTPPHIRELDVLMTYRLNFSYFYFPFLQYALRNVVPSRLFELWSLPDQPSLNHFVWWFPYICISWLQESPQGNNLADSSPWLSWSLVPYFYSDLFSFHFFLLSTLVMLPWYILVKNNMW